MNSYNRVDIDDNSSDSSGFEIKDDSAVATAFVSEEDKLDQFIHILDCLTQSVNESEVNIASSSMASAAANTQM